jgi:unsaturated chondroitin disaccharide hydrolase
VSPRGLLRLGNYCKRAGLKGEEHLAAGLTIARTLFAEPHLSRKADHEGLILHSVCHRPNGWDHIPAGKKIPCGEATMWGDYHAREPALLIPRVAEGSLLRNRGVGILPEDED